MIGAALQCLRCGHEWNTRTERKPVQCPRCKSPAWDRNRLPPARPRPKDLPSFSEIPAFGAWADRTESDEEILAEIRRGWGPIESDAGWGDPAKSDDEMLREVRAGWKSTEVADA